MLLRDHHLLIVGNGRGAVNGFVQLVLADNASGALKVKVVIPVLAEDILFLVDVSESKIEDDGEDTTGDGRAAEIHVKYGSVMTEEQAKPIA